MERETTLSKSIRVADDQANYDAACKRLLSEKIILAWILKSCVQEYQDCDVKKIAEEYIEGEPQVSVVPVAPDETNMATMIHGIGNEDASLSEGTITYDIRFMALAPASGGQIGLIINVEAQNDFFPGYPLIKRGIYYCGRMLSAQYGTVFTSANYKELRKVYSIWICMNPPKNRENTITRYEITEKNLVGSVKETVEDYDLMAAIMICLGKPGDKNYSSILRLLAVLLSTETEVGQKRRILQEDFDIPMTQVLERRVEEMCNLSKGVWEKGMKQGMEQGMKQGLEKGILLSIKGLMENMGWSVEQAMSAMKIPEADRLRYTALLKDGSCAN